MGDGCRNSLFWFIVVTLYNYECKDHKIENKKNNIQITNSDQPYASKWEKIKDKMTCLPAQ